MGCDWSLGDVHVMGAILLANTAEGLCCLRHGLCMYMKRGFSHHHNCLLSSGEFSLIECKIVKCKSLQF